MSSLKMTFSLTSLILIIAFAAMPAMAHDLDNTTDGLQHAATGGTTLDDAAHSAQHMAAPTVESIELVGTEGTTISGRSAILVADPTADPLVPTVLTETTAGLIRLKITFSGNVYDSIDSDTAAPGATDLTAADLVVTAAAQSATTVNLIRSGGITVEAPARQVDDGNTADVDESDDSVFFVNCTAIGFLDHSHNQDCAIIQSY